MRPASFGRFSNNGLGLRTLEGFDYKSILGQCCEMPVGYVQIPVGIAGPLLLDGFEYSVLMVTTEGCLIASTNRGCKAIHLSGGATSVLLRDGMTRASVVRFNSAKRASELKFFLEDPKNFETLSIIFHSGYAWLEVLTVCVYTKVGAPPEVIARLEEACSSAAVMGHMTTGYLGEDPALDQFMEAYYEMLTKYEQELSKPFKEAMFFLQRIECQFQALSLSLDSGCNADIHVIAKIQSADSIPNLHSIIPASDGVSSSVSLGISGHLFSHRLYL
ncbi:3-hydroxy-3-methylglutaryl-coenzyme A reductase 1-like isoform X2 [Humulus lupulus]|uniref:3-hydroxy-3-methylglutaryl-coenzyme A reductase 1-like isoform X2 n=1 Tax=Humulus lupulus TaxID=3486 RepID=UPI002B41574B|nr:3-hydroxy-3-methylglutaryl-coenzyme A reductase 1-like isoform X2 [Humulus lupulus]